MGTNETAGGSGKTGPLIFGFLTQDMHMIIMSLFSSAGGMALKLEHN